MKNTQSLTKKLKYKYDRIYLVITQTKANIKRHFDHNKVWKESSSILQKKKKKNPKTFGLLVMHIIKLLGITKITYYEW